MSAAHGSSGGPGGTSGNRMFAFAVVGLSCLKLLLIPAYRSTDFEVHRNWLAVTHSLAPTRWYVDDTSPWTLDYPPLFAWFEFLLSQVAQLFDPAMLEVSNLNYASELTVLFQRLSVVVTDLVYAYGCRLCSEEVGKTCGGGAKRGGAAGVGEALGVLLLSNAGLLLVDHIHFQYNGFLSGILFISIARILQRREVEAAFWFTVLLNLKHIYLYLAPAYFIYLLRSYVLGPPPPPRPGQHPRPPLLVAAGRLLELGVVVVGVTGLSFGPFILHGQLGQVLSRLFPFRRGLCHAYWAPNFWALYNLADKLLVMAGGWLGWAGPGQGGMASMTGGLVQEYSHAVLPSVSPPATLLLTVLSILPCLVSLWRTPQSPWQFVRALVLCGFGSFMFGWHVHEKAVLMVVLPLGLLCLQRRVEAKLFVVVSVVGHFSLFPLFFTPQETPIKVTALLLHAILTCQVLQSYWGGSGAGSTTLSLPRIPLCNLPESLYLLGLAPLLLYVEVGHALLMGDRLPFLPLLLVSVYCSLGLTCCWVRSCCILLTPTRRTKKKTH